MDIYTEYCKTLTSLPDDWEVYSIECIPNEFPGDGMTHFLMKGCSTRPLKSGPRKGQRTWRDGKNPRSFVASRKNVFSFESKRLEGENNA